MRKLISTLMTAAILLNITAPSFAQATQAQLLAVEKSADELIKAMERNIVINNGRNDVKFFGNTDRYQTVLYERAKEKFEKAFSEAWNTEYANSSVDRYDRTLEPRFPNLAEKSLTRQLIKQAGFNYGKSDGRSLIDGSGFFGESVQAKLLLKNQKYVSENLIKLLFSPEDPVTLTGVDLKEGGHAGKYYKSMIEVNTIYDAKGAAKTVEFKGGTMDYKVFKDGYEWLDETADGSKTYYAKKSDLVFARQSELPFNVKIGGKLVPGNAGDILIQYSSGGYEVMDPETFNKNFVTEKGLPASFGALPKYNAAAEPFEITMNNILGLSNDAFNGAVDYMLRGSRYDDYNRVYFDQPSALTSLMRSSLEYEKARRTIADKLRFLNQNKPVEGSPDYAAQKIQWDAAKSDIVNEVKQLQENRDIFRPADAEKLQASVEQIITNPKIKPEFRAKLAAVKGTLYSLALIGGFMLVEAAVNKLFAAPSDASYKEAMQSIISADFDRKEAPVKFINEYPGQLYFLDNAGRKEILDRKDGGVPSRTALLAGAINELIFLEKCKDPNSAEYALFQSNMKAAARSGFDKNEFNKIEAAKQDKTKVVRQISDGEKYIFSSQLKGN